MDLDTLWYVIAAILAVVGFIGIVLPAIPGTPLIFIGMLIASAVDGFARVQWWWLVVLGVLTGISLLIDFWASAVGAKRVGASKLAILGAVIGTFAGLLFGPIGLFLGPFIGALVGELLHGRRMDAAGMSQATKVGIGTWVGMVFGIVLKLGVAFTMVALFAWAWYR